MSTPLKAAELLDREFLTMRCRVLDLAAALDRLDRAEGSLSGNARLEKIRQALGIVAGQDLNRAEQVQMLFSLPYEENWRRQQVDSR